MRGFRIYVAVLPPCYPKATPDTYHNTCCHNPEDSEMNLQPHGNHRSYVCNLYGKRRFCGVCSLWGLPMTTTHSRTRQCIRSLSWYADSIPAPECLVL